MVRERIKRTGDAVARDSWEQVFVMVRERIKRTGDAANAEASKQSRSETKTPKALKPETKIVKKTPNQSSERNPHKAKNVDKNQEKNKKERDITSYMVMGLPHGKRDTVVKIKPGFKLFLYDFDAKLLYGIYEATSAGGVKLEPAAFGGSYPAQVRFKVHMECVPISEVTFKKAIMGNSGGDKIKFDSELTTKQVKKLTSLFQPSHINSQSVPAPLIPLRPLIPTAEAPPHSDILARGQIETLDPLCFTVEEYRMFGLRRPIIIAPTSMPIPAEVSDHSQANRDTYDRYAPLTKAPYLSKLDESEYKRPVAEEAATQPNYYHSYSYGELRNEAEASKLHSTHAANALSEYNRSHQQSHERGDYGSLSVSSRYSFGGPSFWYR
ncbi:uncharacterized protein A4U43_C06F60 [Asparagus officinalis]|uniref:DCD domain-containing protein n=1 Tax=Asparagus officinalis TaxID=4686 RepID=A0A5P1EIG1_ASPOF|nr:uncharacterized protein A4U43_C06F60 [Asparagus officinalis]